MTRTSQISNAGRMLAVLVLLALLWQLRQPLMLIFGAVLVAAALRALADPLSDATRLSLRAAMGVVLVTLLVLAGVGIWLLGDPLAAQLTDLR